MENEMPPTAKPMTHRSDPVASQAPLDDPLASVDPELRAVAQIFHSSGGSPPISDESLARLRRGGPVKVMPLLPDIPVAERRIPGPVGAPEVTLYLINTGGEAARPAILHMHGGGYIAGTAKWLCRNLQELAAELDCAIVSVDYRLAPETRYSGSVEDNYAALRWVYVHADQLGIDPRRIAVMGESAGGGHAALLALAARDRGEVPVLFQSLLYPMLDDRTGSSRVLPPHIGALIWTAEANRFAWRCFLGAEPGGADVPSAAVPARATGLEGLPPAFIGVGSIELFVDECIDYAHRLILAGVATELLVVPGAFHGFDGFARDTGVARRFAAAKVNALRKAFRDANAGSGPGSNDTTADG
jgi:acetyl esterase/lipase